MPNAVSLFQIQKLYPFVYSSNTADEMIKILAAMVCLVADARLTLKLSKNRSHNLRRDVQLIPCTIYADSYIAALPQTANTLNQTSAFSLQTAATYTITFYLHFAANIFTLEF